MAAGKQKNTPVIVMKKKRHIISPPPPELPSGTVENEMPAHQAKKNKKWTPEFINTSLEKVKALFPLLRAEEGGFRPLKIGITRDVTDFITQNPDAGLTLPERNCLQIWLWRASLRVTGSATTVRFYAALPNLRPVRTFDLNNIRCIF